MKVNGSLISAYPGTISFPSPATARVEAVPATGYRFDQWSGDLDGSANPSDLVVDSRKNVQANFLPLVHSTITPEEAQVMMQTSGNVQAVDVREASEYCSGHIPGSVNYPWNSGVFQLRYGELQKNRPVLLICRSGVRADRAGRFLDSMGYPLVYVMQGGMVAWASDIEACEDIQLVHFPYVVSDGRWETEIAIINTSAEDPLEGVLIGYRDDGEYVSEIAVDLLPGDGSKSLPGIPVRGSRAPARSVTRFLRARRRPWRDMPSGFLKVSAGRLLRPSGTATSTRAPFSFPMSNRTNRRRRGSPC